MLKFLKRIARILLFVLACLLIVNLIPATDAIAINSFMKGSEMLLIASQSGCGNFYPSTRCMLLMLRLLMVGCIFLLV
jgi:hypothetical protein